MKSVVVFGATGTVGAYACMYLKNIGYEVIAVGHRYSDNGFFKDNGMSYISLDIQVKDDFDKLPSSDICAIIHLAGMLPARMKGYEPQSYIDVNISGTLNVLIYAERVRPSFFIYSQSISDVSYLCGSNLPIPSDVVSKFPINNDHSVYSITKNAAVDLIIHYAEKVGFKYYILRFPNIYLYHPNPMYYVDGLKRWQGYRLMIHKALRGEPISIWGNPNIKRDIVYVKDCTQIIEKCISSVAESGYYNVGTGIGVSLKEQVEGIVEVFSPYNNKSEILYDSNKPDSIGYVFDVSKTKQKLGYIPKYDYISYLNDFKIEMERETFAKLWGYNMDILS